MAKQCPSLFRTRNKLHNKAKWNNIMHIKQWEMEELKVVCNGRVKTRFIWVWTWTIGELLWSQYWIFRNSIKADNSYTSGVTIKFPWRTLLHGVSHRIWKANEKINSKLKILNIIYYLLLSVATIPISEDFISIVSLLSYTIFSKSTFLRLLRYKAGHVNVQMH